ncbi:MAG: 5-methylcytosine-specific restriction endonuclease system specificity protein McrC [Candidatus Pararuminococcus gallinarum]|jgi:5-methylcytosine-specific restriction endonuclease McrBC regulatory subunit McrC
MTNDKGILIKNIYYMLTYVFQVLRQSNYEDIASESFEQVQDLFAAILSKGISQQLKQGLYREYISQSEVLPVMRGKLDIQGTIRQQIQRKRVLSCEYDELSENNIYNQILKTTATMLVQDGAVATEYKQALRKTMLFFDGVDTIEPSTIRWNMLRFQRSNRTYQMLMNVCYFVLDGLLQTTENGNYRMAAFSDDHMAHLYEKFILEYYRHHHTYLQANAAQVKWNLDEGADENVINFLPIMQTDITLRYGGKTLIIDAKYYTHTMQSQFNSYTLHSNNLYQIFTYVKNMDTSGSGSVSGMLLYAKTGEAITPDCDFPIGGNRISVKTLDLNCDFKLIAEQLDEIAEIAFGTNRELSQ